MYTKARSRKPKVPKNFKTLPYVHINKSHIYIYVYYCRSIDCCNISQGKSVTNKIYAYLVPTDIFKSLLNMQVICVPRLLANSIGALERQLYS